VLQSPRERHQSDDELSADSTADTRGGGDGARRWTASGGGGASPANPLEYYETRGRAQNAPRCSSPPRGSVGGLLDGGKAADRRSSGGGATRVSVGGGGSGALGFGAKGGAALRWQPLNRPERAPRCAGREARDARKTGSGCGPYPGLTRPEVGDDGRDPPVSRSGRRRTRLGRTGPQAKWATETEVRRRTRLRN
jgi:hypothetical protein